MNAQTPAIGKLNLDTERTIRLGYLRCDGTLGRQHRGRGNLHRQQRGRTGSCLAVEQASPVQPTPHREEVRVDAMALGDLWYRGASLVRLLDHGTLLLNAILAPRAATSPKLIRHHPFSRSPHLTLRGRVTRCPSTDKTASFRLTGNGAMRSDPDAYSAAIRARSAVLSYSRLRITA